LIVLKFFKVVFTSVMKIIVGGWYGAKAYASGFIQGYRKSRDGSEE